MGNWELSLVVVWAESGAVSRSVALRLAHVERTVITGCLANPSMIRTSDTVDLGVWIYFMLYFCFVFGVKDNFAISVTAEAPNSSGAFNFATSCSCYYYEQRLCSFLLFFILFIRLLNPLLE